MPRGGMRHKLLKSRRARKIKSARTSKCLQIPAQDYEGFQGKYETAPTRPHTPASQSSVPHQHSFLPAGLPELCALGKLLPLSVPLSLFSRQLGRTNNRSYLTGLVLRVKRRYLLRAVSGADQLRDASSWLLLFFCVCLPQKRRAQQEQGLVRPVKT